MQPHAGQPLQLADAQQRPVGELTVKERSRELICGTFAPGAAFPAVEHLFRAFEEAADTQALPVVDEIATAISTLGLRLRAPDDPRPVEIHDLQIWTDGGVSFRLSVPASSVN